MSAVIYGVSMPYSARSSRACAFFRPAWCAAGPIAWPPGPQRRTRGLMPAQSKVRSISAMRNRRSIPSSVRLASTISDCSSKLGSSVNAKSGIRGLSIVGETVCHLCAIAPVDAWRKPGHRDGESSSAPSGFESSRAFPGHWYCRNTSKQAFDDFCLGSPLFVKTLKKSLTNDLDVVRPLSLVAEFQLGIHSSGSRDQPGTCPLRREPRDPDGWRQ